MGEICIKRKPKQLRDLADDESLVRFITQEKLQSLVGGKLWIPSLAKLAELNDPNEGTLDDVFNLFPNPRKHDAQLMEHAKESEEIRFACDWGDRHQARVLAWLDYLRNRRAASSWFLGPYESYPMWEAYAKGGVAVTTTVRHLKEAIGYSHGGFLLRPVLYYENRMQNLPGSSLRKGDICPCFLKPQAFEGEKEVRLICKIPPRSARPDVTPRPTFSPVGQPDNHLPVS